MTVEDRERIRHPAGVFTLPDPVIFAPAILEGAVHSEVCNPENEITSGLWQPQPLDDRTDGIKASPGMVLFKMEPLSTEQRMIENDRPEIIFRPIAVNDPLLLLKLPEQGRAWQRC